jgi:hypothetical protein
VERATWKNDFLEGKCTGQKLKKRLPGAKRREETAAKRVEAEKKLPPGKTSRK